MGNFLDSNFSLDVVTESPWEIQISRTPTRTYPILHRRAAVDMALVDHTVVCLQSLVGTGKARLPRRL